MKPLIFFITSLVAVSCGNVQSNQRQFSPSRNARQDQQLLPQGLNFPNGQGSLSHEDRINLARQRVHLPLPFATQNQQASLGEQQQQQPQQNLFQYSPQANFLTTAGLDQQQNEVRIGGRLQTQEPLQLQQPQQQQTQFNAPEVQSNNLVIQQGNPQQNLESQQLVLPQQQQQQQINLGQLQRDFANQVQISQQQKQQQQFNVDAQQQGQQLEARQAQLNLGNQQLLGQQQLQFNPQPQFHQSTIQPTLQPTLQPQVTIQPQLGFVNLPQSQFNLLQNLPRFNLQQLGLSQVQQQQLNIPQPIEIPKPQLGVQPAQLPQLQISTLQPAQQTLLSLQQASSPLPHNIQDQLNLQQQHQQINIPQQPQLNLQQQHLNIPQLPQLNLQQQQLNLQEQQLNVQQQQSNIQPTQLPQLQITSLQPATQPLINIPQPTPAPQQQLNVVQPTQLPQQVPLNLPQLNVEQPQAPAGPQHIELSIPKVEDVQQQQRVNVPVNVAQQERIIHKNVYFHVAPEDTEPLEVNVQAPVAAPPRTHYKIIFIKAPNPPPFVQTVAAPPVQDEEKTIVYVLVKKPEAPTILLPPAPVPSKPEVFFVKYRAQKESQGTEGGGQAIPILEDAIRNVENAGVEPRVVSAGESVESTSLSTTAAPVYGTSGYQKRNT